MRARSSLWLLIGILTLATALRLAHAGLESLWFDEAFAVLVARLPLRELVAVTAGDVHPPLYFIMLHLWQGWVGDSEFAARGFSGLCSLLAVASVYRLGARLFGRRAGLWAAGLMAVAPFQIYYAQEARFYALCVLLSAWLLWAFVEAATRPRWTEWAMYACLAVVGLYTHYFFGFVLIALHLWALVYCRRWIVWRALLIGDLAVMILCLPNVHLALSHVQAVAAGFWIERPPVLAVLKTLDFLLFAGTTPLWLVPLALFGTLSLLAIVGLDLTRLGRRDRVHTAPIVLALSVVCIPIIAAFGVSQLYSSIYLDRSFALVTPAYLPLLAFGLAKRTRRSPSLVLAALLGVVAVISLARFYFRPDVAKPRFREVAADLALRSQPGDVLLNLHDSTYLSLRYYAPQVESYILEADQPWLLPGAWARLGTHVSADWIAARPAGTRLWIAVEPRLYDAQQRAVLEGVERQWRQLTQSEALGIQLYLFQKPIEEGRSR